MNQKTYAYPRPRALEWALLAVNIGVVVISLFLLPIKRDVAIISIAWFGSLALLFAVLIGQKLRRRVAQPLRVQITGGVAIRPSRVPLGIIAAWIALLGGVILIFGWLSEIPAISVAGIPLAGLGFWMLFLLVTGRYPSDYFQLDPSGLTFGAHHSCFTVQWDDIAGVGAGEVNLNPVLLIQLREPDAILVHPPERTNQVFQQWTLTAGAQILLNPSRYRMDLRLLMQALDRYVGDPSARLELLQRKRLSN